VTKIFISYRRDDAAGWARHLASDLEGRFGRGSVFIDIDRIAPGEDFVHAIDRTLAASGATLVVIGPGWLGAAGRDGRRRLDVPDDLVRQEIVKALVGSQPVIPVLVGHATMPAADDLPDELKPLARRQAFELSDTRRSYDVGRLCEVLEGHLPAVRRRRMAARIGWLVLAGAAALAAFALLPWRSLNGGQPAAPADNVAPAAGTDRQIVISPTEITKAPPYYQGPFAYQYAGSGVFLVPADGADSTASKLLLFEDGRPLGPGHQPRQDVYVTGKGRYSHYKTANGETDLIFSTSDNSDPRTNGRTYTVSDVVKVGRDEIAPGKGYLYQYTGFGATLTTPDEAEPRHRQSKLRLFEDGKPLPQAHAGHQQIEESGRGRYSHWSYMGFPYVNFSTLVPGEDPRSNGRTYTIRIED
jgi:hypothetical protein